MRREKSTTVQPGVNRLPRCSRSPCRKRVALTKSGRQYHYCREHQREKTRLSAPPRDRQHEAYFVECYKKALPQVRYNLRRFCRIPGHLVGYTGYRVSVCGYLRTLVESSSPHDSELADAVAKAIMTGAPVDEPCTRPMNWRKRYAVNT